MTTDTEWTDLYPDQVDDDPQAGWMTTEGDDTPGHWSGCDTREEYEGTR